MKRKDKMHLMDCIVVIITFSLGVITLGQIILNQNRIVLLFKVCGLISDSFISEIHKIGF